jgi:hypothetical protein
MQEYMNTFMCSYFTGSYTSLPWMVFQLVLSAFSATIWLTQVINKLVTLQ